MRGGRPRVLGSTRPRTRSRAFDTYESSASFAKAHQEIDNLLVSHIAGITRRSILEIGCGRGRMTQVLADLFETVVALDISPEATSRCRAFVGASNVLVVLGDDRTVAAMPSGSFDVVFSYATFQHISGGSALRAYITSAARLIDPNGIALLQLRQPGWRTAHRRLRRVRTSRPLSQDVVALMARSSPRRRRDRTHRALGTPGRDHLDVWRCVRCRYTAAPLDRNPSLNACATVQVVHRGVMFCLGVSGTDEPSDGIARAWLVVAGGVEGEVAELFAVGGDDSDVEVADEDEYSLSAVGSADADVVEA